MSSLYAMTRELWTSATKPEALAIRMAIGSYDEMTTDQCNDDGVVIVMRWFRSRCRARS